jgi:hypothetical protein
MLCFGACCLVVAAEAREVVLAEDLVAVAEASVVLAEVALAVAAAAAVGSLNGEMND